MDATRSCLLYGRRTGTQILKGKTIRKYKDGGDVFQDYFTDSGSSTDESSNSDTHSNETNSGGISVNKSEKSSHHDEPDFSDIDKGKAESKLKENILPSKLDNLSSHEKSYTRNMTRKIKKHNDNIENQSPLKKLKLMKKQSISLEERFTLSKQNKLSNTKSLKISEAMNSSDSTDSEIDAAVINSSSAVYKAINISRKILMAPKLISRDLKLFEKNNADKQDKSKYKISKTVSPLSKIINKTSILSPRRARHNKRQTKTKNEMEIEKILSNYDEYDALIMQMMNEKDDTGIKNLNSPKDNIDPLLEKSTESINSDYKSNNTLRGNYADVHNGTNESNQIEVPVEDNYIESSDKILFQNKRSLPRVNDSKNINGTSRNMLSHISLDKCSYGVLKNQTKSISSLEESKQFDEDNSEDDVENVQKSDTANNQVISLSETFKPTRKNTSSPRLSKKCNSGALRNQSEPNSSIETFDQNNEESSVGGDIMENITKSKTENNKNLNSSQSLKDVSKNVVSTHNCLTKQNSNMSLKQANSSSFYVAPENFKLYEKVSSNDDVEGEPKSEQVITRKIESKSKSQDKTVQKKTKNVTKPNEDLGNHISHQSEHLTSGAKSPEQELSSYKNKTRLSHKNNNTRSEKEIIPCKLIDKNSTGPIEKRKSKRLLSQFESGKTQDLEIDENNAAASPGSPKVNSGTFKNLTNNSNKSLKQNCEVPNVEEDFIKSKTANEQSLNNSENITETSRNKATSPVSPSNHTSSVLMKKILSNSFSKFPDKSETDGKISSENDFKSRSKKENKQSKVVKDKDIVKDIKTSMHHNKKQNSIEKLNENINNHTSYQSGHLVPEQDISFDKHIAISSERDNVQHKKTKISSKDKKSTDTNDKGIVENVKKSKLLNKKQNNVEELNENPDNYESHHSGHLTPEQDVLLDQNNTPVSSERDVIQLKRKRISSKDRKLTGTNDVRRSTRQRYLPLDHWRNERLLYRFESGQIKILGIDKGTKEDNAAFVALEKKRMPKNVKLRKKVIKGKIYDTVHNKKICLDLLKTYPSVPWDEPASSSDHVPYRFKRVYDTYNTGFGFIEIDGLRSKPTQYMPDEDLQMTIIKGHVEVIIQDNSFKAINKDMFIVPRGTAYSLKNLNSTKALLMFVVGKFKFCGTK